MAQCITSDVLVLRSVLVKVIVIVFVLFYSSQSLDDNSRSVLSMFMLIIYLLFKK